MNDPKFSKYFQIFDDLFQKIPKEKIYSVAFAMV